MDVAAIILGIVASLSGIGNGVLAYLSSRDKMRFDAETGSLRAKVEECERERLESVDELKKLRERADTAERENSKFEGQMAGMEREMQSLRQVYQELRGDHQALRNRMDERK